MLLKVYEIWFDSHVNFKMNFMFFLQLKLIFVFFSIFISGEFVEEFMKYKKQSTTYYD